MVHGWPGSFYEFYKILPLLTDPKTHGLSDEHVFEVICPSIPGYGFSEASSKKGTGFGKGNTFRLCYVITVPARGSNTLSPLLCDSQTHWWQQCPKEHMTRHTGLSWGTKVPFV